MYKRLTPEDCAHVRKRLLIVMTKLEVQLPMQWNTSVVHIFVFHSVFVLEMAEPFCSSNMLDIERFHTLFKGLARGTKNIMRSICNHYVLQEASQMNRNTMDMEWAAPARRSSIAGLAQKPDSAFKTDRCYRPRGTATPGKLSPEEFGMLQDLWGIESKAYDKFQDAFKRYNARRGRDNRMADISEWSPSRQYKFTDEQKLWQTMSTDIMVRRSIVLMQFLFTHPCAFDLVHAYVVFHVVRVYVALSARRVRRQPLFNQHILDRETE